MTHAEFIADRVGNPKWVLGRNTVGLRARYPDSTIVSHRRYAEIEREYRAEFGDPYDKVRAELYLVLSAARKALETMYHRDLSPIMIRIDQALEAERNAK